MKGFMKYFDVIKSSIQNAGGIIKTTDLLAAGVPKNALKALVDDGALVRIRHGYYRLADTTDLSEAQYLAAFLPEGILCMETALFYYGYSDFAPRKWTVAVPRSAHFSKTRLEAAPIKVYFVKEETIAIGKTRAVFDGVTLPIYDRERTICDCFRYRTKMDSETFSKAINGYVADERKNLGNLSKYAKELGVYKRVAELMEVMLGG